MYVYGTRRDVGRRDEKYEGHSFSKWRQFSRQPKMEEVFQCVVHTAWCFKSTYIFRVFELLSQTWQRYFFNNFTVEGLFTNCPGINIGIFFCPKVVEIIFSHTFLEQVTPQATHIKMRVLMDLKEVHKKREKK